MRLLAPVFLLLTLGLAGPLWAQSDQPDLYLVTFTAEWCPNCKVLDPEVEKALATFNDDEVTHVVLDMTNATTREESFERVDGTILAGVYGDHLGVTGLALLTAPDSGEKIGCITREFAAPQIIGLINEAREIVRTQAPNVRQTGLGQCPGANRKVAL